MKIDNSNKSYSMIIAGILVMVVLSIFMAISLGVRGCSIYVQETAKTQYLAVQSQQRNATESNIPENNMIVSLAEKCEQSHDTEPGCIVKEHKEIPYDLPLCITQDVIDDWWIMYKVCGGYEPEAKNWIWKDGRKVIVTNNYGWIVLDQTKTGEGGYILITQKEITYDSSLPCCCAYVNLSGFVLYCGQDIHLDSNKLPTGCQIYETGTNFDLDKMVDLDIITNWEGCHLDTQEFRILWAHKDYFTGIPNSRIKI
jgi:hypothetical protein